MFYVPELHSQTETIGQDQIQSLENWKDYVSKPDLEVHELFSMITEHQCRYLEILKKYFDFDIIAFHDDWGNNKNMFFSPEMWREFIRPYIQKVIDKTHDLGMFFEMHSCGYISPVIGDLVQMGVDGIDPLQYCNNVPSLKAAYGRNYYSK